MGESPCTKTRVTSAMSFPVTSVCCRQGEMEAYPIVSFDADGEESWLIY